MSIIPKDILKEIFSNFFEKICSHFLEEIFSSFPKEIFSSFLKRNTVKLWPSLPHATFNKGRQLEENIHYSFYFRKTFVCKKINDFNFLLFKKAYLSIFRQFGVWRNANPTFWQCSKENIVLGEVFPNTLNRVSNVCIWYS